MSFTISDKAARSSCACCPDELPEPEEEEEEEEEELLESEVVEESVVVEESEEDVVVSEEVVVSEDVVVESGTVVVGFSVVGFGVVVDVLVVALVELCPFWHEASPMTGRRSSRAASFLVFFIICLRFGIKSDYNKAKLFFGLPKPV